MDFFAIQDRSHRNTRLAIFLFVVAVIAIVVSVCLVIGTVDYNASYETQEFGLPRPEWFLVHWQKMLIIAGITLSLIAVGSIYQISRLGGGGGYVARSLGGRLIDLETKDLQERRLLNIVTEMAIASGVPSPEVYLLPDEEGINAFAAGFTPSDAAIGVTRGCITQLNRDELQGVIAHEYSHIINGDMRLNIRLMGVLHGILLIAIAGQTLLSSLRYAALSGSRRSRRNNGGGGGVVLWAAVIGLALIIIGYIGVLFSRIIQSVVSRQREYLADASAVQFTRNPGGIGGALKKIAGFTSGSKLRSPQAEEVSHMLFGSYRNAFFQLFATHPPIVKRIQAIDPQFRPEQLGHYDSTTATPSDATAQVSGFSAGAGSVSAESSPEHVSAEHLSNLDQVVGNPGAEHLAYAKKFLADVPQHVIEAANRAEGALALIIATSIHPDPATRKEQIQQLKSNVDEQTIRDAAQLYRDIRPLGPGARLPLIDLAMPAIHRAGAETARSLVETVHELAWADGSLSTFEFALVAVLQSHFRDAFEPKQRRNKRVGLMSRKEDIQAVFGVLAMTGAHGDRAIAGSAYSSGMQQLLGSSWPDFPEEGIRNITELEAALEGLDALRPQAKRQFVKSLATVTAFDGQMLVEEYELLRAICETIHCPLPPLVQS